MRYERPPFERDDTTFVHPVDVRRAEMAEEERIAKCTIKALEACMPNHRAMTWDERSDLESADERYRELTHRDRPVREEPIVGEHTRRRDNALVGWGD